MKILLILLFPLLVSAHLEPVVKDANGKIIVPKNGFRSGIPAVPMNIKLVQVEQQCDTSELIEGRWMDSNNPEMNIAGLVAFTQVEGQWKFARYYIFPMAPVTDWLHMWIRYQDLGLNPCIPNKVLFRYLQTDGVVSYNSYMTCYGVGCDF